ncbi:MAG: sulfite exporter TauE/SafE family protein [Rhodomicrobium sp.]
MAPMDVAYPLCGFLVGGLVGLTGMGGGSLMTPLLILFFGVNPVTAVGTDLFFAAATKATGARVHAYRGNVEWKVVGLLALGSVPGALGTVFTIARLAMHGHALGSVVTIAIAMALMLGAAGLLFGQTVDRFAAKIAGDWTASYWAARPIMTVALGLLLGIIVSLTSVGAGAVGMVVLRQLYPRLAAVRLVGSDITHAVPLTLLAGSGHWFIGDVQWALLGSLLLGSIPGIIIASHWAHHIPDKILRPALGLVLLGIAGLLVTS